MKQRIRVVGIVKTEKGLLLLKRSRGRMEELPSWELPTGKIKYGEQPEEALARSFFDYLGVQVTEMKLVDAVTFVGFSSASQLFNLYIIYEVFLGAGGKLQATDRYSAYKYVSKEESFKLKLDEATLAVLNIEEGRLGKGDVAAEVSLEEASDAVIDAVADTVIDARGAANGALVYVDGSSRGNPGPTGVGYYIVGENGEVLKRGGEFIGFATSRVAEYYALKEGCKQALALGLSKVRFISDNLMVVNQMKGIYQVKNRDLIPIYEAILEMLPRFKAVSFSHVKREQNMEADLEANRAVEEHFSR